MPHVKYFWDEEEDNVVREYDENNNTLASFTTEPTLYGSVLSQNRGGEARYYQFDGLGNTTELSRETGAITDMRRYDAFGETTAQTGLTVYPFRYKGMFGEYSDHETGVQFDRSRAYDPEVGRGLSAARQLGFPYPYSFVSGLQTSVSKPPKIIIWPAFNTEPFSGLEHFKKCGAAVKAAWQFELLEGAPCEGYFVQQVDYICQRSPCKSSSDGAKCPHPTFHNSKDLPKVTYWEAWHVAEGATTSDDGKSVSIDGKSVDVTDGFQVTMREETCGLSQITGRLRFYCKDKNHPTANGVGTSDIGRRGQPAPGSGWKINATYAVDGCDDIETGDIPSVNSKPGFWKEAAVESERFHWLRAWWVCCPKCKYGVFGFGPKTDEESAGDVK